ncbi:hypothetical protein [Leucobacter sp. G161]|uniref:hypothetical protein n=1 Tax=Leucobacter sp. G161 TaxID=663704 RepID=UPI00073C727D|nr:hypothetical protein [Leucobacter sp. G161]KUF07699.1 hypothetical protein AUL38_07615 [Leucobacter sp. G161]
MTEAPEHQLATEIEGSIRAVPGVTALFRTGSTVAKLVGAGADLVRGSRGADPLVRLELTPEGPRVTAALGVRAAVSSVETLERVHLAIETLLAAHGLSAAEIHLTVVHVNGTQ